MLTKTQLQDVHHNIAYNGKKKKGDREEGGRSEEGMNLGWKQERKGGRERKERK